MGPQIRWLHSSSRTTSSTVCTSRPTKPRFASTRAAAASRQNRIAAVRRLINDPVNYSSAARYAQGVVDRALDRHRPTFRLGGRGCLHPSACGPRRAALLASSSRCCATKPRRRAGSPRSIAETQRSLGAASAQCKEGGFHDRTCDASAVAEIAKAHQCTAEYLVPVPLFPFARRQKTARSILVRATLDRSASRSKSASALVACFCGVTVAEPAGSMSPSTL